MIAARVLAYAFVAGGYLVTVMSFAVIYGVFVTGLNFFMGYAGQVSFGHNAFAALAATARRSSPPPMAGSRSPPSRSASALALAGRAASIGYPTLAAAAATISPWRPSRSG